MKVKVISLPYIFQVLCFMLYLDKILGERLQDHWSSGFTCMFSCICLFPALINLLKFILSHESLLVKKHNIFHVCSKVSSFRLLYIGETSNL